MSNQTTRNMDAIINISTGEQIKRAEQCSKHRVVMMSSDEVHENKYAAKLGQDPVAYLFTYDCPQCVEAGRPLNLVYHFKA